MSTCWCFSWCCQHAGVVAWCRVPDCYPGWLVASVPVGAGMSGCWWCVGTPRTVAGFWCVGVTRRGLYQSVKRPSDTAPLFLKAGWRWCPTLPHPGECSTIGVSRLSFRVRNGTGRFPGAMTTATIIGLLSCSAGNTRGFPGLVLGNRRVDARDSVYSTWVLAL